MKINVNLVFLSLLILAPLQSTWAATNTAQFANIGYDVVYVRCPRGNTPVQRPDGLGELENWNGVNDIWLSASNNIYQLPGCDLVLHHSDPNFDNDTGTALPAGHPDREEVLVDCDESRTDQPVCSIADPNVSLDGGSIVYAKFMDTREFVTRDQWGAFESFGAGWGRNKHSQAGMTVDPTEGVAGERFATRLAMSLLTYDASVLIYRYDLSTGEETRISPAEAYFSGRAYPSESSDWSSVFPVMDTGPFFLPDGRIGFTSNRADGFLKFQLFTMDPDGKNLELIGHRAMSQQLHPFLLKDGRIVYTSFDSMLQREQNNQYSLFSINPDGSDPFIFAGENDATAFTFHYATQLSDGDIVSTIYYNHNNVGMGTFIRFPVDPAGADFANKRNAGIDITGDYVPGEWYTGGSIMAFARVGQYRLTLDANARDDQATFYDSPDKYWNHPSRAEEGSILEVNGTSYNVDKREVTVMGKFSHPAAAPDNDLLATYTIGGSSTLHSLTFDKGTGSLEDTITLIGKDAGVWLFPLEANSQETVGNVADDGFIVVDHPEYHEIMPRAVVPYSAIYGENPVDKAVTANVGNTDVRLPVGAPFALTGSASLFERETAALNGTPWNMKDGGGAMSGRTYLNLTAQGGDLALYDDDDIWGIRVSMPVPTVPYGMSGGYEQWAGRTQYHHVRILGEYPIRKFQDDDQPVMNSVEGKEDTSFIVRIPADTPFFFQAIDKRGMALNIETTSRSAARGEQQFCSGCHLHTREGENTHDSVAKTDTNFLGDFTGVNDSGHYSGESALLFEGLDAKGRPTFRHASEIYSESDVPGVTLRKSFAVDWEHNIKQIVEERCGTCHAEGSVGHRQTGLRLRGDDKTYELLTLNQYTNNDGERITASTLPGDGLSGVGEEIDGGDNIIADRITPHWSCCTPSRWISYNSARSSMLIWALYQERLDGRDPETGLPPAGSDVVVDDTGREYPEIWPNVADHSDLNGMTEEEKRLLARWIDMGAPKTNTHDDLIRPVVTITPGGSGGTVDRVYIGVWDDSPVDYDRLAIRKNGSDVTPSITGTPSVIEVPISPAVSASNASTIEFEVEVWDEPNRSMSLRSPGVAAANRTIKTFNGDSLLRMADVQVNSAPTSASAAIETFANRKSEGVVATVVDPDDGDSHVITIASQASNGTASVENNRLYYTPDTDFTGNDSFQFTATDLSGDSVTGTASVTVTEAPDNNAPTSASAAIQTFANRRSSGVVPTVVDADEGDSHTIAILSQPSNGVAEVDDGRLYYTPDTDFVGNDSFEFTATDTGGASVTGTASITVVALNSPPTSASAIIETFENRESSGVVPTVLDPDEGDSHTIAIATQPANGTASVENNRLVYLPGEEFVGEDSFDFTATDTGGESVTGTASVTVVELDTPPQSGNSAPVSASAVIETFEDRQSEGVDASVLDPDEGDSHTIAIATQPANGTASVESNLLVYMPDEGFVGEDNFQFTATDSGGESVTGTAAVTVVGLNSAPTSASAVISTIENRKSAGVDATVLDPDEGDSHTLAIASQPANGTATVEGNQLFYTPNAGFVGNDSFNFTATDEDGESVTGTASVTVESASGGSQGQDDDSGGDSSEESGGVVGLWSLLALLCYFTFARRGAQRCAAVMKNAHNLNH